MTPAEFEGRMIQLAAAHGNHWIADVAGLQARDDLMVELLDELGYGDGARWIQPDWSSVRCDHDEDDIHWGCFSRDDIDEAVTEGKGEIEALREELAKAKAAKAQAS